MIMGKRIVIIIFLIAFLLFCGCEEKQNNNVDEKFKVFIANNNDDGFVARDNAFINGVVILENTEPMKVGLFSTDEYSTNQLDLTSRGILRFDISEWDNTNITFFIKCLKVQGSNNPLDVYFMDDPGVMQEVTQPQDILSVWSLTDSSPKYIMPAMPVENEWVEIFVPKLFVQQIIDDKYSKNEHMTIMLQLFGDELIEEYDNYYEFATVDYTPNDDSDQPYIQFGD